MIDPVNAFTGKFLYFIGQVVDPVRLTTKIGGIFLKANNLRSGIFLRAQRQPCFSKCLLMIVTTLAK
jgi:hypothetical protein